MHWLLVWLIGYAFFMYLMTPIIIRFSQKMAAHPALRPADLVSLPPPAAEYLGTCQKALESEGFETVSHLTWENSAPNVFPLLTLFMNRATSVKAIAAAFYVVSGNEAKMTARYVEFITRYEGGLVLCTNNNISTGTFQHGPNQQILRLPEMKNPHDIYSIHRQRMAQVHEATVEPLPPPGAELPIQEQRIIEDYEEQVQFGRLYLDREAGIYRPTWKGAYLMTWSQLQPMKALRQARSRREAREALKLLGEPAAARQV